MSSVYVTPDDTGVGVRIDLYLSQRLAAYSRSKIKAAIDKGFITVNGKPTEACHKVKQDDIICVEMPPPDVPDILPQDIPLDIFYEDRDIIVVNKPKGMVVHPAAGNNDGTLANALLFHCGGKLSDTDNVLRPGIIHRIDKDTSGLLVAAKNDYAHAYLADQFREHSIKRVYTAIVCGVIKEDSGMVDKPIGRHPYKRKKMAVNYINGKRAVTHFTVIKRYKNHTLLELKLETGRTHQIRVHLSSMSHPLLCDAKYGGAGQGGQALHAGTLGFIHPVTNDYMEFTAQAPLWFTRLLETVSE